MNELDKLRAMLTKAGIPYEDVIEPMEAFSEHFVNYYGGAGRFRRNQIIYGRNPTYHNDWKFDAVWQYGSYGAAEGKIETYGTLGVDADDNPQVMNAADAFEIIKKDYENELSKNY